MQNLAGVPRATELITEELKRLDIPIIDSKEPIDEPKSLVYGQLGDYIFKRAWYYYKVSGDVPLNVAEELYSTLIGKQDIRVVGHCGCPHPSTWAKNGVIDHYHIDSEVGMYIFVQTLKKHKLV